MSKQLYEFKQIYYLIFELLNRIFILLHSTVSHRVFLKSHSFSRDIIILEGNEQEKNRFHSQPAMN